MKDFKYNNSKPYIILFMNDIEPYFSTEDTNAMFSEYLKRDVKISSDVLVVSTITNEESLIYKQNKLHNLGILFINPEEYDKIDKSKYKYILYLAGLDALILRDLDFKDVNMSLLPTTMSSYKDSIYEIDDTRLFTVRCMDKNVYPKSFFKYVYSNTLLPDYENRVFVIYEFPITIIDERLHSINIIKDNLDPLI